MQPSEARLRLVVQGDRLLIEIDRLIAGQERIYVSGLTVTQKTVSAVR
jgi:hypothetical protein